jgi:hypothetical protein
MDDCCPLKWTSGEYRRFPRTIVVGENRSRRVAKGPQVSVRQPIQHKSTLTAPADWISQRSFQDSIDCVIDREGESLCSYFATLLVPLMRFDQFLIRFGMESDRSHPRRKSFALTSSQGIVATVPESISRHLRSASSAHSSSTSGSGGGSRLSMSKPANVARSLSGSSNASRKTSFRSRDIGQFYRECHCPNVGHPRHRFIFRTPQSPPPPRARRGAALLRRGRGR